MIVVVVLLSVLALVPLMFCCVAHASASTSTCWAFSWLLVLLVLVARVPTNSKVTLTDGCLAGPHVVP